MDRRTPTPQGTPQGDSRPESGTGPDSCPPSPPEGGAALIAGKALVQTVGHFFPDLNRWLDRLPDTRDPDALIYETRFLGWWGIHLYLLQLGSRRQLDFELDARATCVLHNINRLAGTDHDTRPVHDTLDHFLEHVQADAFAALRTKMVRRLIRMKALDAARLAGKPVVSVGSEFIENAAAAQAQGKSAERVKQDCELKAFDRLAPQLKAALPQTRFVLGGDSLFACGRVLQSCCWSFNALQCAERSPTGETTLFAWITDLPLTRATVVEVAEKGGRQRWKIENEGFNRQKNSGLNLCHVYSTDPEKWKAYYYLLHIAFVIMQLCERGSLLKQLAAQLGQTPLQLFGSLKNLARRLLEALRYLWLPEESFDTQAAARLKIRLDTS